MEDITKQLSQMEKDLLKEIANIGLGHAATSIAKMTNTDVSISLPKMELIEFPEISNDKVFSAVTMAIEGQANGVLLTVFDDKTSYWIIDTLMGQPEGTTSTVDEMGESALKEFANILGGAFLSSLADFIQLDLMPKPPSLFFGDGNKIKENVYRIVSNEVEKILFVKTEIFVNEKKIEGDIYLILDHKSFKEIFSKML